MSGPAGTAQDRTARRLGEVLTGQFFEHMFDM